MRSKRVNSVWSADRGDQTTPGGKESQGRLPHEAADAQCYFVECARRTLPRRSQRPGCDHGYSDFDCSFCAKYVHEVYPLIAENYIKTGKIKYFFRDLPAPRDTNAFLKAQAARCAGEQGKFWEMHDWLFANQSVSAPQDLTPEAKALGFRFRPVKPMSGRREYTRKYSRSMARASKSACMALPRS